MKPVVLGAGLGGLSAALSLAPMPVLLVSPCSLGEGCSTAWAQGGIAAAVGHGDDPKDHAADTLRAGNDINDKAIVQQTTGDAPEIIQRLINAGVAFDRDAQGVLDLTLEAAHGRRRIVHSKDSTGLAIIQALIKVARATPSIEIIENARATDLVVRDRKIVGIVLEQYGVRRVCPTNIVVLATGSSAALWRDTTVPLENWGSGLALAARAGATLGDLEFMQFHPTAIDVGRDPMPLASESLRGEGAILIDETGKRFTDELRPRDVVARANFAQIAAGHKVFIDARTAIGSHFPTRFPSIYAHCMDAGLDPVTTPIPVRPAAHYHMGGVLTDPRGRTDIEGLWACGEVACTGLHGANRLASNSLLEAASFGWRAGQDIKSLTISGPISADVDIPAPHTEKANEIQLIRGTMSDYVGVIRNREGLQKALAHLTPLAAKSDMALLGQMIAQCALQREESRGAHTRSDFPQTDTTGKRSTFRFHDLEKI